MLPTRSNRKRGERGYLDSIRQFGEAAAPLLSRLGALILELIAQRQRQSRPELTWDSPLV